MPRGGKNHAQGGVKFSRAQGSIFLPPPLANFSCTPLNVIVVDLEVRPGPRLQTVWMEILILHSSCIERASKQGRTPDLTAPPHFEVPQKYRKKRLC